jgi:hypothetical protein
MKWQRRFYGGDEWELEGSRPRGAAAVAPDGSVYLASVYLTKLTPDGAVRWQFRGDTPLLGTRLDADGNVEVASERVTYVVSPAGQEVRRAPNASFGHFVAERDGIVLRLERAPMGPERRGFNGFNGIRAEGRASWEWTPGKALGSVSPPRTRSCRRAARGVGSPGGRLRWSAKRPARGRRRRSGASSAGAPPAPASCARTTRKVGSGGCSRFRAPEARSPGRAGRSASPIARTWSASPVRSPPPPTAANPPWF